MCNWKKWIWPGILAVIVLTALSTWFRADPVENDLTAKATGDLAEKHSWASVELDGRDLTLRGTAPSPEAAADALKISESAYDVRIVQDATELLAEASPYKLTAVKSDGSLVLTGNVPNDDVRAELITAAESVAPGAKVEDKMTLARGAPKGFGELAGFSIAGLAGLADGTTDLTDTDLTVVGTAESFDAYDEAVAKFAGAVPSEGQVTSSEITPPTASPYELKAEYDGENVILGGYAASAGDRDAIEAAVQKELPDAKIENGIRIAAGAPENFVEAAEFGFGFFGGFTQGRASFSDTDFSISGVAKSPSEYEAAIGNLENLTAGFNMVENTIQPVGVSPYEWGARLDGQAITLNGYAPATAVRDRIGERTAKAFPSASINNRLEIAGGETGLFDQSTELGISLLERFAEGEAKLVDDKLTVKGRAKSVEDYEAALGAVAGAPAGIDLQADVLPPIVAPYSLKAIKSGNRLSLTGFVPNDETRKNVILAATDSNPGVEISDELKIADGVPAGMDWLSASRYAMQQLGQLEEGEVSIEESRYSISGNAKSIEVRDAVKAEIGSGLDGGLELSSQSITAPEPEPEPTPPAPPVADPYRWNLSKTTSGVTISGNVTSDAQSDGVVSVVKSVLGVTEVTNKHQLASGEPQNFDAARRLVANQVKRLEAGQGNIMGTNVSVTGRASSEEVANEIKVAVESGLPAGFTGTTNIIFPKPAPAPEPQVPVADPYRWSVAKQPTGITVRGNIADAAAGERVVSSCKIDPWCQ